MNEMGNRIIQVTLESGRQMLPHLERSLVDLLQKKADLEKKAMEVGVEIARTHAVIDELKTKLDDAKMDYSAEAADRKRWPKGEGGRAVAKILMNLPLGQRLTINELVHITNINYATVYRTLKDPERNKGRFEEVDKKWSFAKAEGVRMILAVLNGPSGLGTYEDEIAEQTGLPLNTVRQLLAQNPDVFPPQCDSRWRNKA